MSQDDNKALAVIPRTMPEVQMMAEVLAKSSLLPDALRGKTADVVVQILAGAELGLPPMASLRGVHVVKGRPVLSADSMVGLCLGSGLADYFSCVEEDDTFATYETRRKGSPHAQRATWTIEDAQRAGLVSGDNWRKYPRAMLKARCKAVLARDVYPDVLAGCYDTDEARDFAGPSQVPPPPGKPSGQVEDADFTEHVEPESPAEIVAIESAASVAELEALAPKLAKLTGSLKTAARAAYKAKRTALQTPAVEGAA